MKKSPLLFHIKNYMAVLSLFLFFLTAVSIFTPVSVNAAEGLKTGKGTFIFIDQKGDPRKPLTIRYYKPTNYSKSSKVLFIIHGVKRNAISHIKPWIEFAEKNNTLLLAPEFSEKYYPGSKGFAQGNISLPSEKWTFSVIEHLFDHIKETTGNTNQNYDIYGHSAGGQFVHRMVLLMPDARINKAVAANAGWYTLPLFTEKFPYGLKNTQANDTTLKGSFAKNLIILLGDKDTDPNHSQLRKTKKAMKQGTNRFDRGKFFFETAVTESKKLNTPLNWRLETVEGAAHENGKMVKGGVKIIFGN